MMRELDETTNSKVYHLRSYSLELIKERDILKREILRKHAGESVEQEEARIRVQYD